MQINEVLWEENEFEFRPTVVYLQCLGGLSSDKEGLKIRIYISVLLGSTVLLGVYKLLSVFYAEVNSVSGLVGDMEKDIFIGS